MLIDLEKIRNCNNIRVKLSEDSFSSYLQNINEYFTALERDINTIKPLETMDVITALVSFREYFYSETEWERLILHFLELLKKGLNKSFITDISIFYGLSHVAYSVYALTHVAPKIKPFLHGINDLLLSKLSDYLKSADTKEFNMYGNYEVIKGLSGPFRYLLDNTGDKKIDDMIKQLIIVFIKRAKNITILDHEITGWHYYPSVIEKKHMDIDPKNGCINYGVSHGMGSPLPVLAMAYHKGFKIEGLEEVINGLITEYMNAVYYVDDIAYWPGRVTLEQHIGLDKINNAPNAMSWCYGSVGILRVLYITGIYMSNDTIKHFALEELSKIAKMELSSYVLSQPIICHGYVGTAIILNLMYLDTKREEFIQKTIEMIEASTEYNVEKFFENANQVASEFNVTTLAALHDHLEGFNGIIHSTLTILKGITSVNDKRLLMN